MMTAPLPSHGNRRAITCCDRGRLRIDPHLRGHVNPRTLGLLRRAGFRVVQVGQAAYLCNGWQRWIVGVWTDHRPAWADRLDAHHRWLIGRAA